MPSNLVRTPNEEQAWHNAKEAAAREGKAQDHALITNIFERMINHIGGGAMPHVDRAKGREPIIEQLTEAAKRRKGKKAEPDDDADESPIIKKTYR